MCGILGTISLKPGRRARLALAQLAHRGPDSAGEWVSPSGRVWLGHTRLAILDLSPTGGQPMQDASARWTIVFNGEIYNHRELRAALPGVEWRGTSDTETLLAGYAQWGRDLLPRLRGMFAFAIHDARDDSVFLARDRVGIKPLYLCANSEAISFASEVRPLCGPLEGKPIAGLSDYLAFGHFPMAGECLAGVRAVPPGTAIQIDAAGRIESQSSWWPPHNPPPAVATREEARAEVRRLLEESVREHLLADVPVASFLSGGIDSSIVTLLAAQAIGARLKTFCIGFPQAAFDERAIARRVAEVGGTDHQEIEVSPGECLQWVIEAVGCLDLPSVDAINSYIVAKAVHNAGWKVALSGLGGDELFGGYPSFRDVPKLAFLGGLPPSLARALVSCAPRQVRDKLEGLPAFDPVSLATARRRLMSPAVLQRGQVAASFPRTPAPASWFSPMGLISWAEMQNYMGPMLLRDSDQMSMAVGLELRVPFLDHRLIELALALPDRFKGGVGIKPLLVDAFRDLLPREVYDRPKQGFVLPMDDWMRGPLREFCEQGLDGLEGLMDSRQARQHAAAFEQRALHWTRLWQWVVLGHWWRKQR